MTTSVSPYTEITRQIARTQQSIREYRLHVVLSLLLKETIKSTHVQALEAELTQELSKRLQSPVAIDVLLEELESHLLT